MCNIYIKNHRTTYSGRRAADRADPGAAAATAAAAAAVCCLIIYIYAHISYNC